mmetsp:Transcript_5956/g.5823  ORF Transcript_5956/g.5823 Transcript_5956/m.5823 type:complete len:83 (-) Transcript_5956:244-492(-)
MVVARKIIIIILGTKKIRKENQKEKSWKSEQYVLLWVRSFFIFSIFQVGTILLLGPSRKSNEIEWKWKENEETEKGKNKNQR